MGLVAAQIEHGSSTHTEEFVGAIRSFSGTLETGEQVILRTLILSSLILTNYVLFESIAALLGLMGMQVARHPAMLLFCFCGLVQSLLMLPVLMREVVHHVEGGNVSRNVLHFLIIATITLGLGYQVVAAIDSLFTSSLIALVLTIHCFIAFDRSVEYCIASFLDRSSVFSLDTMVKDVRIPSMTAEKGESCVVTSRWLDSRALRPGDIYQVKTGEVLPCDGIVIDGVASITERYLSGAPEQVCKGKGDEVCAGSTVEKGTVTIKVVNRLEDSIFTTFIPHVRGHLRTHVEAVRSVLGYMSMYHYAVIVAAGSYAIFSIRAAISMPTICMNVAALLSVGLFSIVCPAYRFLSVWTELAAFVRGVIFKTANTWNLISKVSACAMHYERKSVLGSLRVQEIQKLDQRVDVSELYSILMSLSGSGQDEADRAIARYLVSENPDIDVYSVENYHYYSDKGVCGLVNQIDVTLGSEEFLIERGVYLQESDTVIKADERVRYVAFNEEVVACIHYFPRGVADGRICGAALKHAKVPLLLLSHGSQEALELYRKRIDIDVSGVHAELDPGESVRLVEEHAPLLLYGDRGLPVELDYAAKRTEGVLSAARFNELEWSVSKYDATFFVPDLDVLGRIVVLTRAIAKQQFLIAASTLVLFACGLLLYASVGVVPWAYIVLPMLLYPFCIQAFFRPESKRMYPLLSRRRDS